MFRSELPDISSTFLGLKIADAPQYAGDIVLVILISLIFIITFRTGYYYWSHRKDK